MSVRSKIIELVQPIISVIIFKIFYPRNKKEKFNIIFLFCFASFRVTCGQIYLRRFAIRFKKIFHFPDCFMQIFQRSRIRKPQKSIRAETRAVGNDDVRFVQ